MNHPPAFLSALSAKAQHHYSAGLALLALFSVRLSQMEDYHRVIGKLVAIDQTHHVDPAPPHTPPVSSPSKRLQICLAVAKQPPLVPESHPQEYGVRLVTLGMRLSQAGDIEIAFTTYRTARVEQSSGRVSGTFVLGTVCHFDTPIVTCDRLVEAAEELSSKALRFLSGQAYSVDLLAPPATKFSYTEEFVSGASTRAMAVFLQGSVGNHTDSVVG